MMRTWLNFIHPKVNSYRSRVQASSINYYTPRSAHQIPDWLTSLLDQDVNRDEHSDGGDNPSLRELQQQLADEGGVIRWCIRWLEQLGRGEKVVVNLRSEWLVKLPE